MTSTPLHMSFDPHGELGEAARRCEAEAQFAEYGQTRSYLDKEFQEYEDHSVFVTISDDSGVVHGAARYIVPGPHGLSSLNIMNREPWFSDGHETARAAGLNLASTWDVATISRRPGSPARFHMAVALCHGLILAARQNDVSATVAILNTKVRRLLATVGLLYQDLPGMATLPFDGSAASTPVFAPFSWQMDTARHINPEGHRLVVLGVGLDGIRVPPPADFHLDRTARLIDLVSVEEATVRETVIVAGPASGSSAPQ